MSGAGAIAARTNDGFGDTVIGYSCALTGGAVWCWGGSVLGVLGEAAASLPTGEEGIPWTVQPVRIAGLP